MTAANRVLFLSNSITKHPPLEDSGWNGADWGMAASAMEKDYVPEITSEEAKTIYRDLLSRVLRLLTDENSPEVFMRSSFWADSAKDGILRQVCDEFGGTYVDISDLATEESTHARSEPEFERGDVGNHPGNADMARIAQTIWSAVDKTFGGV